MNFKNYFVLTTSGLIFFSSCKKGDSNNNPPPSPVLPTILSFSPAYGQVGTQVTITGTDFSPSPVENALKFNGTAALVTAASTTQLVTTVPTSATTGKLSVTVKNNTATSTDDFLILTGSWTRKADYGGAGRNRSAGFSIGNKGYIVTAYQLGPLNNDDNDLWEYDASANQWTRKADFPGIDRENALSFSLGGKGYITLGYTGGQYTRETWEYDPSLDKWIRKADFPGKLREFSVSFSAGGKGFVGPGVDFYTNPSITYTKELWEYDPIVNQWARKVDYPGTVNGGWAAFAISDKGYLGGGGAAKEFWEYNTVNGQWTSRAPYPGIGFSDGIGFSAGSKGYLGFGSSLAPISDLWEYDPATDKWTRKADFPGMVRDRPVAFMINNKGYVGTGRNSTGAFKDFWEFTP